MRVIAEEELDQCTRETRMAHIDLQGVTWPFILTPRAKEQLVFAFALSSFV